MSLCVIPVFCQPDYAADRYSSHSATHSECGTTDWRRKRMARLTINGQPHNVDVDPDTPLLWVIREQAGLTGTKYGCGIAQCGACTVHVEGVGAVRSCSMPVSAAEGMKITTIEGLAQNGVLTKVQK